MIIASLDLATSTGWAAGHREDGPSWGRNVLPRTGTDIGAFLQPHDDWLDTFLHKWRPDVVTYEAPILHRSNTLQTCRKLYSLAGVTEMVCRRHHIRCHEVDNQKVKRFFTGYGGKKGGRMIMAARDRGWKTASDDEADALGIWLYTAAKIDEKDGTRFAMKFDPMFAEIG